MSGKNVKFRIKTNNGYDLLYPEINMASIVDWASKETTIRSDITQEISDAMEGIDKSYLVTLTDTQTITGPKTFINTAITMTSIRKNNSSGIYAGIMMKRELESGSTPPSTYGIGGYFKARNTSNVETHAGLFGGRLTPAIGGESSKQVGEVVFSPSWENVDPNQRADFRIRATSGSTANVYLTGDFYAEANSSGKDGKKLATENYVNTKIASTYKAMGNLIPENLKSDLLIEANLGNVYNIIDSFTTTVENFVEGKVLTYDAGTNVAIVKVGNNYKFDVLAGFVDLSSYVPTIRTINNKALSTDVSLTASDVGAEASFVTLGITKGGTNISNYTKGDILYASDTNILSKLTLGSVGEVLKIVNGLPTWASHDSNVQSDWNATTGSAMILNKPLNSIDIAIDKLSTTKIATPKAVFDYVDGEFENIDGYLNDLMGAGTNTPFYTKTEIDYIVNGIGINWEVDLDD